MKIYVFTNRLDKPYYRAWSQPVLDGYSRVHTTFDQVAEIAADLEAMGVAKCLVLLAGWNRAGYNREHVDMWPPAAGAGGVEGLQRAARAVRTASSPTGSMECPSAARTTPTTSCTIS